MSDKPAASAKKRPPDRKTASAKPTKAATRTASQKELPLKAGDSISRATSKAEPATVAANESVAAPAKETATASSSPNPSTSSATTQSAASTTPARKASAKERRVLDVFLVDSGWNNEVGTAVRDNLPVFAGYLHGQRFYVLTQEQSRVFISKHPSTVGADPILIVLDRQAAEQKSPKGYGFRLCLGHMRNAEAAISMLKWAIQLTMASNGPEMSEIVKKSGHRQTFQGTIELIGEGSAHFLEFAPV